MKIKILISLFCVSILVNAQYTKLLDFSGANGSYPKGSLISDGTFLYGMTYDGGASNLGTIFKIKPDGTGYVNLLDFTGSANGQYPRGSLVSDGTLLYGMTYEGGANNFGTIFKIMPNGTGYLKLLDFSGTANGKYPRGSLMWDGTFLYGMTYDGGANNLGTIFKIMPNGTGYVKLLDFSGTVNGANPYGDLISDGTFLYGMTANGGTNGMGTIFKIMPNGTGYSKLLDFAGSTNGREPFGALIADATFLYGTTYHGGTNDIGTIFKIKPDGTGYVKLLDFNNTANGSQPFGSLISDGSFLYGMTGNGGVNGIGVLFKIKHDGTGYSKLLTFAGALNGSIPNASLISDGIFLYGTTQIGGASDLGTVFKYQDFSISASMVGTPQCSNLCVGTASTTISHGVPPYTYLWSSTPTQTTASASGLCPGIYSVTVTDAGGVVASDTVTIHALPAPTIPQICLVTVDTFSQNNIVVWDKTPYAGGGVDSFIVYREVQSNVYKQIGAVPFDSLSMFTDTIRTKYFIPPYFSSGDPNAGTYRYKIQIRDTCGNYSALSPFHNTIFMSNNNGTFSWPQLYTIEGSSNPVSNYLLMRDNFNDGNWQVVNSVTGSQQTVTDAAYTTWQATANWRITTNWSITCTPSIKNPKGMSAMNTTKSNTLKVVTPSKVHSIFENGQTNIYPNPSMGKYAVTTESDKFYFEIYNVYGEKISCGNSNGKNLLVDISDQPDGIYFLQIKTQKGTWVSKIVKK